MIQLALGWKGQPLFPKGAFTVDEIEHSATDTDSVMLNVNHAITEQHAALRIIDQQLGDLGQIAINHASAGEEIATTMGALANIATHMRHEVEQFRL